MIPISFSFRSTPAGRMAVLGLLVCLGLTGCSRQAVQNEPVLSTVIVQAVSSGGTSSEDWSGSVRARNQVRLAFSVAGRVQRVGVEAGDQVEAGAVLAELDKEPFKLALQQAETEVQAAEPLLMEALTRRESEERLWAQRATSRADLDAAVSAHAAASARLKAGECAMALARRQLQEACLRAPSAGRIAQRSTQNASWIEVGAVAFEFDPEGVSEVVLAVPSEKLASLQKGQTVAVNPALSGGVGRSLWGQVTNISLRSQAGGVHEVLVRLDDSVCVYPGQTVSVSLPRTEAVEGLRVPLVAIIPSGAAGQGLVYVFDETTGQVVQRRVGLGSPRGAELEVRSGLRAGELVVVAGAAFLRDGQKVQVQQRQ